MIFLDTTFLVDYMRRDVSAIEWLETNDDIPNYTSEINAFELYTGLFRVERQTGSRSERRRLEIEQVLSRAEVLPLERPAAIEAGKIMADLLSRGRPVGIRDVMIAGIARASGIPKILTRNQRHFEQMEGIVVETY